MIRKMTLKWMIVLAVGLLAAPANAEEAQVLKTQKDKISYGIGVSVGKNFKQQGIEEIDLDIVIKGLRDSFSGGKLLMSEDELRATLNAYQEEWKKKQLQARKVTGERNMKEGEAFLAENKKKKDVVTLPSGLQYKILKKGDGKKPIDTDTVECQYRGALVNGTEFDSSSRAGKPLKTKVTGVIPGWTEALKLMTVGSKWQLFIPSKLAYGERGAGNLIGPNATLIFDLELVAIK
ncbi:MAG: FKBP-type peptidyl-prolyl cis-trans isomerase [Syntrophales bacterium]|nr:FKBP-type peptidyl-prolyl cis-trans isomerase [Syntrophales bacterium]